MQPRPRHSGRWRSVRRDPRRISRSQTRPASLQHRLHFFRQARKTPRNCHWVFLKKGLMILADGHRGSIRNKGLEETKLRFPPLSVSAEEIVIGVVFFSGLFSADQDIGFPTPARIAAPNKFGKHAHDEGLHTIG